MEEDRMAKKDLHPRTGRNETKGKNHGKDGKRKQKEIFKCWE